MTDVYKLSESQMLTFFLVLIRLSSFIVAWPVFSAGQVPQHAKVLLALALTFLVFPLVSSEGLPRNMMSEAILFLAIKEAFIGLSLGFLARLFFFALAIAGQIVSVSIGFSAAQLFNPTIGETTTVMDQFHMILGTLFFLGINGHHVFLSGLFESFRLVPLSPELISIQAFADVGRMAQEIMILGVKFASPVMVAMLFTNVAMAVVSRAVPQINVLITSLPVNILIGFLVILVTVPLMIHEMGHLLDASAEQLFRFLKAY